MTSFLPSCRLSRAWPATGVRLSRRTPNRASRSCPATTGQARTSRPAVDWRAGRIAAIRPARAPGLRHPAAWRRAGAPGGARSISCWAGVSLAHLRSRPCARGAGIGAHARPPRPAGRSSGRWCSPPAGSSRNTPFSSAGGDRRRRGSGSGASGRPKISTSACSICSSVMARQEQTIIDAGPQLITASRRVAGGIANRDEPCAKEAARPGRRTRMVAAKLSAPSTTSSISEQPSSAKAQARMAGHAWCWQAEIISMATHSSRQKPSQSTAAVSRSRRAWRLMARTQQERSVTAALAALAPSALE